jgi:hypothetical protein
MKVRKLLLFIALTFAFYVFGQSQLFPFDIYSGDLVAYLYGAIAWKAGHNPYELSTLYGNWDPNYILPTFKRSIWNPPIIFPLMYPLTKVPIWLIDSLWRAITFICAIEIINFSYAYRFKQKMSLPNTAMLCVLCGPLLLDISLLQIAVVQQFLFLLGVILYIREYYFISGIFLSAFFLKPHPFLIPAIVIGIDVLKNCKYKVVFGSILILLALSLVAVFYHPTIYSEWINRTEWPYQFLGANLSSFIRSFLYLNFNFESSWIISTVILINILIAFYLSFFNQSDIFQKIVLAILFNIFTSPYGFYFDQVSTLFIVGALIPFVPQLKDHTVIDLFNNLKPGIKVITGLALPLFFLKTEYMSMPIGWFLTAFPFIYIYYSDGKYSRKTDLESINNSKS